MKKPTYEEYIDIGKEFKRVQHDLMDLHIRAAKLHGKTQVSDMRNAMKYLDKTKSKLDDRLFSDYPEKDTNELCKVFYGPEDPKKEED